MLIELAVIARHIVEQFRAAGKVADQFLTIFFQLGFVFLQFVLQYLLLAQFTVAEPHRDSANDDTDNKSNQRRLPGHKTTPILTSLSRRVFSLNNSHYNR